MNFLRRLKAYAIDRPVVVALAVSLLLHTILLFGPELITLKPAATEPELPPLAARLEPRPVVKAKSQAKKRPAPKSAVVAKAVSAPQQPPVEMPAEEQAAVNPPEPATPPVEVPSVAIDIKPAHPLPKQAQLTFIVHKGINFPVGQAKHRLEISDDGHYSLRAATRTIGLISLLKSFEMNQLSLGTVAAEGLRPDTFSEEKVNGSGAKIARADFDWQANKLVYSSGNDAPLPERAQDMLSFLYQLSQLPLDKTVIPMYISNGRKLERYELAVGEEEDILTRNGKMRALPLRKIHAAGEEGLEIWLGLEYRLLPVKIRQIDRNGDIAGEMVISDIRVSEE